MSRALKLTNPRAGCLKFMNAFGWWTHWFSWGFQFLPACCRFSAAAAHSPPAERRHELEPGSAVSPSPPVLHAPADQQDCPVTLTLAKPTMLSILFSSCKTTRLSSQFNIDKFIDQLLFDSTPVNLMVLSSVYNPWKFNSAAHCLQPLQNQQDCLASSNPANWQDCPISSTPAHNNNL